MLKHLVIVSLLVCILSNASASEGENEVAVDIDKPQRSWFYRAFDSIEDTFKEFVNKIESGFVKSVEESKINSTTGPDGTFANRTQEIIEKNGQKFLKTKIVERKSYTEREVVRLLTPEEEQKLSPK